MAPQKTANIAARPPEKTRCPWANHSELEAAYHDVEWGTPSRDDTHLFELLNLEGAQAGLSWHVILKKRSGYRACFDRFDAKKIARYDAKKLAALVQDDRIVRHAGKISAVVDNAKAFLLVQREFGSFSKYCWAFVGDEPIRAGGKNRPTPESLSLSKDLKKRGFRFVGPTTVYAFMQAVGMVDDHDPGCFRAVPGDKDGIVAVRKKKKKVKSQQKRIF